MAGSIPAPIQESPYNGDIAIPHYVACIRADSGKHRKGIRGERPEALTIEAHVREALSAPVFRVQEVELPPTLTMGGEFSEWSPGRNPKFFVTTGGAHKGFKNQSTSCALKWRDFAPAKLKGVTMAAPSMLAFLFKRFGLCGSRWLKQVAFGFPATGVLSQKGAHHVDNRAKSRISARFIFRRFQKRATSAMPQMASELRKGVSNSRRRAGLRAPHTGRFFGIANYLPTQRHKRRLSAICYSGRQVSGMRRFTSFFNKKCLCRRDPIKLFSWGHVAHICNLLLPMDRSANSLKKIIGLRINRYQFARARPNLQSLWVQNPSGGKRYAFASRTLLFGPLSSVIQYSILPRAIAAIVGAIFGIPLVIFGGLVGVNLALLAAYGIWRSEQFFYMRR